MYPTSYRFVRSLFFVREQRGRHRPNLKRGNNNRESRVNTCARASPSLLFVHLKQGSRRLCSGKMLPSAVFHPLSLNNKQQPQRHHTILPNLATTRLRDFNGSNLLWIVTVSPTGKITQILRRRTSSTGMIRVSSTGPPTESFHAFG